MGALSRPACPAVGVAGAWRAGDGGLAGLLMDPVVIDLWVVFCIWFGWRLGSIRETVRERRLEDAPFELPERARQGQWEGYE